MFIFIITLSLIVLIYISFLIKIPKVSFFLGAIYVFFILKVLINGLNTTKKDDFYDLPKKSNKIEQKDNTNEKFKYKNNIEPKPLVIPKIGKKKTTISNKKNDKIKKIKEAKPSLPKKPYATTLTMRDMQICRSVKNRNPIGTDTYFKNTVDSLFCYTRVQNTGGKQELTHIWYFEDQKIGTVKYNIKTSNIYRSWTRKTILSHQIGTWRVEVQDTAGVVIGSEFFYITNPDNQ